MIRRSLGEEIVGAIRRLMGDEEIVGTWESGGAIGVGNWNTRVVMRGDGKIVGRVEEGCYAWGWGDCWESGGGLLSVGESGGAKGCYGMGMRRSLGEWRSNWKLEHNWQLGIGGAIMIWELESNGSKAMMQWVVRRRQQ